MPLAELMTGIAAFLFGTLLGSFLNVCISRLPEHRSISTPRSHCPQCLQIIRWYDNVPLLSWLLLRGRCRHCRRPIPWRYPLVEISMGLWSCFCLLWGMAATAAASSELSPSNPRLTASLSDASVQLWMHAAGLFLLGFLLLGLMVMDWQKQVLPDAFTLTGCALGLLLVCVQAIFLPAGAEDVHFDPRSKMRLNSPGSFAARGDVFLTGPEHLVFGRVVAILAAAAIPLLIRSLYRALRKQDGMGWGDVKLMAMIAAFLGFWPAVLAMFVGVLLCAVYSLCLLALRRADRATRLPLGSFLAAGGLLAGLAGEPLIAWYRALL